MPHRPETTADEPHSSLTSPTFWGSLLFWRATELIHLSHQGKPIITSDVRRTTSHSGKDGGLLPHNNDEVWDVG